MLRHCVIEPTGEKTFRCVRPRCNRIVTLRSPYQYEPSQIVAICRDQKLGLGDYLSIALAKLGITKPRVNRLLERWARLRGKPPQEKQSGCGCTKREQALNRFGWAWERRLNSLGWYCRHRYVWIRDRIRCR